MAGKGNGSAVMEAAVAEKSAARNAIRESIINHERAKRRSCEVEFFGQKIELRQPALGDVLSLKDEDEGGDSAVLQSLLNNAFVPGTEEKVFDETDLDWLKSLPFGPDFNKVATTLTELTTLNFQEPSQSSGKTSTSAE